MPKPGRSNNRPSTDTRALRENTLKTDTEVLIKSIEVNNSKAKRTIKRKRSSKQAPRKKNKQKLAPSADAPATSKTATMDDDDEHDGNSSDEQTMTKKKSSQHNKALYDILSAHAVSEKPSKSSVNTVDEYDARRTQKNVEAFSNVVIINRDVLENNVSQQIAQRAVDGFESFYEHDTFNPNTHSWFEFVQQAKLRLAFDSTPVGNTTADAASSSSSSSSAATETKKPRPEATTTTTTSKDGGSGKGLPIMPINNTSASAIFGADASTILAYITQLEPHFMKMYNEKQRRAIQDSDAYDITNAQECPRSHVDRVLVAPYGNFDRCSNGNDCKAMCTYYLDQPLMGYRTPAEFDQLCAKPIMGVPLCPRLCYICHLSLIHNSVLYQQNKGASCMTVNTPFMHITDQPGEYSKRHMIPHPIRTGDIDVQTPMTKIPSAGTQNSGGLVVPVRMWKQSEYVHCTAKPVCFLDEQGRLRKETRPGLEEIVEKFVQHDTNKPPIDPINPYIFKRHILESRLDTWDILRFEFQTKASEHEFEEIVNQPRIRSRGSIGVGRLKELRRSGTGVVILPIYWALTIIGSDSGDYNGVQQFPFHAVFQKDIRYTADHLEDILAGGRIFLAYIGARHILNFVVDATTPLGVFRSQLEAEPDQTRRGWRKAYAASLYYRERRLYLAYLLRDAILRTLRVVYPNSTSYNDPCFHGKFQIADEWNHEHYGPLFEGGPLDRDVDQKLIDEICARPVPYNYFASDADFIKVRTEIVVRENPRIELSEYYVRGCGPNESVLSALNCHLAFMPFEELRTRFASKVVPRSVVTNVVDFKRLEKVIFVGTFPKKMLKENYAELSATHAVALAVMFRISASRRAYEYEEIVRKELEERVAQESTSFLKLKNKDRSALHRVSASLKECKDRMHRLTSFIYSHFELLERAERAELCSDKSFYRFVPSKAPNAFMTHYEEVEPLDTLTVHEGNLPDLTYTVTCVNFVVNTKEGNKGNESQQPVLRSMFRKMYPKCCQSRNAPEKHVKACETNVSYLDTVRCAFRMTMMGGYHHSKQLPSMNTAMRVYQQTSIAGYDRKWFLEQQRRYPHFFLLCMTEMLVFFTRQAPAYHEFILSNYPTYACYEHSVLHKANLVRRMYDDMSMDQIETFISGLEIFINADPSSSSRSEFHVFRPVRVDPIKKLATHIQNINQIRHEQGYYRPEMPHLLQRAIIHTVYSLEPNRDTNLIELMLRMNQFHTPGEAVPDWKRNVKRCTPYIIFWVLEMMECAQSDELIEEVLNCMPPTDWEIFDLMINMLSVHYSVNILRLPEHIRRKQEKAIRQRFDGIEHIGPDADGFNVTMCCQEKSSFDATCGSVSPHTFFGQHKVSYKVYAQHVVCAKKKRAIQERKSNRHSKSRYHTLQQVMSMGDQEEILEVCHTIANRPPEWQKDKRFRYQPECGKEPIVRYSPLSGHVIQFTNVQGDTDAYAQCTKCAAISGFSRRMFNANGFTCMSCEASIIEKLYTPVCAACRCFIVLKNTKKKNKWRRFMVFNDGPGVATYRYEVHYACANGGCCDLQTSKINGESVYSNEYAMTSTSDLQRGRRVGPWNVEASIRTGAIDVRENMAYFRKHMTLPSSRRGARRKRLTTNV